MLLEDCGKSVMYPYVYIFVELGLGGGGSCREAEVWRPGATHQVTSFHGWSVCHNGF